MAISAENRLRGILTDVETARGAVFNIRPQGLTSEYQIQLSKHCTHLISYLGSIEVAAKFALAELADRTATSRH